MYLVMNFPSVPDNSGDTPLDTKALASLIIELNIARRNSIAYPKGHPVIAASLSKVLLVYENLLTTHSEIILGITNDSLMLNGVTLEKSNVVYRDFARVLFERGIGALIFHRGVTAEELQRLTVILGLKREQIQQLGGIEQVWEKSRIVSLTIKPIRYDQFLTTEENSIEADHGDIEGHEGLWARFAKKLTLGEQFGDGSSDETLDPKVLAEVLNSQHLHGSTENSAIFSAIAGFMNAAEADTAKGSIAGEPYQKFAEFINNLSPELRLQFLDSSFGNASLNRQTTAERILANLSDNVILETIEDISANRLNVSSTVFGLLERLGRNVANQHTSSDIEEDELASKMKIIMREHASEEFVPDDYQRKLNHIIATDQIPRIATEDIAELMKTVDTHHIETTIGHILMNLIREGVESPEERELLLQNLSDMFGFILQTGDYGQLHTLIDQMHDETFPVEIRYRLRDEYGRREFLEEILDGLTIWGKPRYGDIRSLIFKIGAPFVETILDRLSEEKNMSLRRFYMDCMINMGQVTRVPIANRLYDNRWYFLRNLLIILATQNDPSVVPLIQPLLKHDDPRLRHEALKTLLHFGDHQAEKKVIEELDSPHPDVQTAAIQLAEHCTIAAVSGKLVTMLTAGGFSQAECDKKSAILHALGEIGRADVLPELAKFLSTRSLLHSRQLTKLKIEIIQTLPKYPAKVSRPVLEHIAADTGDLARCAVDALKSLAGASL